MTDNKVKLNYGKAEVMIISPSRMAISVSIPNSFATGNTSVLFSDTINNLGVTVDCHLYFKIQDARYKSIYWQLCRLDCHIHNTQNNTGIK